MSITDELREWLDNAYSYGTGENLFKKNYRPWFGWKLVLEPMLDRIDAEHEGACAEAYGNGVMSVPIAIDESQWVKLPVDADGVPIRVGDVVTMQLLFGGESEPLVVDRMELSHGRDGDLWCIALDTDKGCWNQPSLMRHYYPPTVEGVLTDFVERFAELDDTDATLAELVAEYAAKLRLKEDE